MSVIRLVVICENCWRAFLGRLYLRRCSDGHVGILSPFLLGVTGTESLSHEFWGRDLSSISSTLFCWKSMVFPLFYTSTLVSSMRDKKY